MSTTDELLRNNEAYAEKFGRPICVTDSYRSLESQIDVHERKLAEHALAESERWIRAGRSASRGSDPRSGPA